VHRVPLRRKTSIGGQCGLDRADFQGTAFALFGDGGGHASARIDEGGTQCFARLCAGRLQQLGEAARLVLLDQFKQG